MIGVAVNDMPLLVEHGECSKAEEKMLRRGLEFCHLCG